MNRGGLRGARAVREDGAVTLADLIELVIAQTSVEDFMGFLHPDAE
jgi:hypothetical protein